MPYERLAYFDGLLNAHMNGLRIADDEAWQIALDNLQRWRLSGECFVANVPWLLASSQRPDLARLSAWAISMITGLDLDAQRMTQAAPPEPESSEAYERQRPMSDPEVGLPWPHVTALQEWWQHQQNHFPQGWLVYGGGADDPAHCLSVLNHGPQAARYAAATALAMHGVQWPMFETRAASIAQRAELADLLLEGAA